MTWSVCVYSWEKMHHKRRIEKQPLPDISLKDLKSYITPNILKRINRSVRSYLNLESSPAKHEFLRLEARAFIPALVWGRSDEEVLSALRELTAFPHINPTDILKDPLMPSRLMDLLRCRNKEVQVMVLTLLLKLSVLDVEKLQPLFDSDPVHHLTQYLISTDNDDDIRGIRRTCLLIYNILAVADKKARNEMIKDELIVRLIDLGKHFNDVKTLMEVSQLWVGICTCCQYHTPLVAAELTRLIHTVNDASVLETVCWCWEEIACHTPKLLHDHGIDSTLIELCHEFSSDPKILTRCVASLIYLIKDDTEIIDRLGLLDHIDMFMKSQTTRRFVIPLLTMMFVTHDTYCLPKVRVWLPELLDQVVASSPLDVMLELLHMVYIMLVRGEDIIKVIVRSASIWTVLESVLSTHTKLTEEFTVICLEMVRDLAKYVDSCDMLGVLSRHKLIVLMVTITRETKSDRVARVARELTENLIKVIADA